LVFDENEFGQVAPAEVFPFSGRGWLPTTLILPKIEHSKKVNSTLSENPCKDSEKKGNLQVKRAECRQIV
jgi:hypothetical protein